MNDQEYAEWKSKHDASAARWHAEGFSIAPVVGEGWRVSEWNQLFTYTNSLGHMQCTYQISDNHILDTYLLYTEPKTVDSVKAFYARVIQEAMKDFARNLTDKVNQVIDRVVREAQ